MKKLISVFNTNSSGLWKSLPLFIKICAIYFAVSAVVTFLYLAGVRFYLFPQEGISLYGLHAKATTTSLGQLIVLIYLFKGFIAYALYKGKRFAVLLAYTDAILGIAVWLFLTFGPIFLDKLMLASHVTLSLDILFLVPYAVIMGKYLFSTHLNAE